ncbi:hypothetical protein PLESTB_001416800 [Pleodorina starrii]|uniref:Photosystem I subunit O n=1 Tax=Pleodorina starrii TaxID=330485 RepID=A0A9W6BVD7_9CHLO|nr:hypothetical protein PLESTM_001378500 [Pleodorina starrii]GLC58914.1 hypothetical protein PLESTB_001416800 [Pleodorina starrii]GLC65075.1 hypothetical protein PLESTF_000243900 [Pleodorina starrii]
MAALATRASALPTLAQRPRVSRRAVIVRAEASNKTFPRDWVKTDPLVPVLGFAGWTIPSNIGVSGFDGNSLFGLFTQSIGEQLAHFPTGPALSDKFWLYMITWHLGLFLTITLGQIGVQGRKQGYW